MTNQIVRALDDGAQKLGKTLPSPPSTAPLAGGGAGASFSIHPEELRTRAEVLRGHARTVASHAAAFESKAAGVSFK